VFRLILFVSVLCPVSVLAQVPETDCTPPGTPDASGGNVVVVGTLPPGTWGFSWGGATTILDGRAVWTAHPQIKKVVCDSPAHRAGLRVGDTILEAEGADARTVPLPPRIIGRSYRFKFRRDGEVFEVTLLTVRRPKQLGRRLS